LLVFDLLSFRDSGPYGIRCVGVGVVITVALIMLLANFGLYKLMFVTVCVYCYVDFPSFLKSSLPVSHATIIVWKKLSQVRTA
jgi:hypothetical protein